MPGVRIDGEEQFFDRVFALFVALEYLNILSAVTFRSIALRYFAELRRFRRLHPGLAYLIKADSMIRQAVEEHVKENPTVDFAAAFKLILDDQKHLWNSALATVEWDALRQVAKRPREDQPGASGSHDRTPTTPRKKKSRSASSGGPKTTTTATPPKIGKGKGKGKTGPIVLADEMSRLIKLTSEHGKGKSCRFYKVVWAAPKVIGATLSTPA